MQIASTVDYATESWFLNVFTGALNHQVAHHLFPAVLQTYYPQITPIVKELVQSLEFVTSSSPPLGTLCAVILAT